MEIVKFSDDMIKVQREMAKKNITLEMQQKENMQKS